MEDSLVAVLSHPQDSKANIPINTVLTSQKESLKSKSKLQA
jgi:hypothetical protein